MRVNKEIRAEKVRLIAEDGMLLGIVSVPEALTKAREAGLDLVEIAPNAKPPVCKIIDYGKFRYHQAKKEKESKKAQHQVKVKEVKFKPNIDVHDFETKAKKVRDFLLKGNKVRITCMFRGREMLHTELGQKIINRVCEMCEDIATVEADPKLLGRTLSTVLAPMSKAARSKLKKKEENPSEKSGV